MYNWRMLAFLQCWCLFQVKSIRILIANHIVEKLLFINMPKLLWSLTCILLPSKWFKGFEKLLIFGIRTNASLVKSPHCLKSGMIYCYRYTNRTLCCSHYSCWQQPTSLNIAYRFPRNASVASTWRLSLLEKHCEEIHVKVIKPQIFLCWSNL